MIAAIGAVIVVGVVITAGNWAYKKIVSYFKEHTKPRLGRNTEKRKTIKRDGNQGTNINLWEMIT